MKFKQNKALSLGELLIVIAIIGIIAAVTIPAIMQSIYESQLKNAWRKNYSALDQATQKVLAANGGDYIGLFSSSDTLKDTYKKYLKQVKECTSTQGLGNCWHKNDGSWKYIGGSSVTSWPNQAGLVLQNSALLMFYYVSNDCSASYECGRVHIDVNGFNGPNIVGKDIFAVHITANGILPVGADGSGYTCDTTTGWGCGASIIKN